MPTKRRQHLVELEDLPHFPRLLRDYVTDFLSVMFATFRPYRVVYPLVSELLDRGQTPQRIVDLCSGAGAPARLLFDHLKQTRNLDLILTDKFPNQNAVAKHAPHYLAEPVDILAPEAARLPLPPGIRTLFTSFHHFDSDAARAILAQSVANGQPIAIFETTERSARGVLSMLAIAPLVFALTPFIRPFHLPRLLLTYIIPAIPFCALWDGIVSTFRTYTIPELEALAAEFPEFRWKIGAIESGLGFKVTYMVGWHRSEGKSIAMRAEKLGENH